MIMERMSGPSIFGLVVMTMKHRAAQKRVSKTHWVLVKGFLIGFFVVIFLDVVVQNIIRRDVRSMVVDGIFYYRELFGLCL